MRQHLEGTILAARIQVIENALAAAGEVGLKAEVLLGFARSRPQLLRYWIEELALSTKDSSIRRLQMALEETKHMKSGDLQAAQQRLSNLSRAGDQYRSSNIACSQDP